MVFTTLEQLKTLSTRECIQQIADSSSHTELDEKIMTVLCYKMKIAVKIVCGLVYLLPTPSQPICLSDFCKTLLGVA